MGPCSFSVRHHQYCIILPLTTTVVEVCVFEVKKKSDKEATKEKKMRATLDKPRVHIDI